MIPETVSAVMDLIALLCVLAGAMLCLAASIGLLRFPDLLSRMHAATKPQVLGVLLILLAVALTMRSLSALTMAALVAAFQLLTSPVASQMLSRAAVRTGQIELGRVDGDPVNPAHPPTTRRKRREKARTREKDRAEGTPAIEDGHRLDADREDPDSPPVMFGKPDGPGRPELQ